MGRKHFTEEQIASALRQHDSGTAVAEIIRPPPEPLLLAIIDLGLRLSDMRVNWLGAPSGWSYVFRLLCALMAARGVA